MSEELPGTRGHVRALRDNQSEAVGAGVAPHMGSALHRNVVDHRIKPGTRAYREAMQALAEEPEVLVLTFVGEGTAGNAGKAHFTVAGGVAPYTFDPGDGGSTVAVPAAGAFYHTYAANGDYDVEITDSAPPARVQTDAIADVTVDWVA